MATIASRIMQPLGLYSVEAHVNQTLKSPDAKMALLDMTSGVGAIVVAALATHGIALVVIAIVGAAMLASGALRANDLRSPEKSQNVDIIVTKDKATKGPRYTRMDNVAPNTPGSLRALHIIDHAEERIFTINHQIYTDKRSKNPVVGSHSLLFSSFHD